MLDVVEDLVADAVRSALPAGADVLTGPTPALEGIRAARVVIFATALTTQLSASPEHVRQGHEPAQMLHRYTMGDHFGTKATQGLPTMMSDLIAEVHCPPGRLLSTDLYAVDGRTMHFFSERDGKVVVLTRGPVSPGYREMLPCRLELPLTAWAKTRASAAPLVGSAASAALATFFTVDVILRPLAQVGSLSQGLEDVSPGERWFFAKAAITLLADVELTLAAKVTAEPEAVIEGVELEPEGSRVLGA